MKPFLLFILSVFLSSSPLFAQDVWQYITIPQGARISSMATDTTGTILLGVMNDATGKAGVYRKIYGNNNWEKIFTLHSQSVLSVDFSINGDIYIGTNYLSMMYYSHDNGITWDSVNFPVIGNIVELKAIGNDTVFLSQWVGSGSLIHRSVDAGETWKVVYENQHYNEYITDIIQSNDGSFYASAMGFFNNQGGVYKSTDGGDTWQFIGLNNCMIRALAVNSKGDLFAGSWGGFGNETGGVYILRNGTDTWIPPLYGYPISGMVINSQDAIYCSSDYFIGVVRSVDDGVTFELYNSGLGTSIRESIIIDKDEYLYADNQYTVAKTVNTTVGNRLPLVEDVDNIIAFPNPCFNNYITLQCENPSITSSMIQIVDMQGHILIEKRINIDPNSKIVIDVTSLHKGTYLLQLISGNKKYKSTFVKL